MTEKKYSKILIANRGEIVCRIIRTACRMGISCVSMYSDADINSVHVRQADESRHIGPSPAYLSYLNIEKICEVAVETGAETVHPGYGFLAENPDFPRALQKRNIDFIGPSAETIEVTANKITAKESARKAGVNVVPGYMGKINDAAHAASVAEKIGFPVMLKAASGGGGKGMRIVNSKKEIELAFTLATNEAKKNFKDDSIFIEKYIELPRHIEIQIIADKYGNVVCLGQSIITTPSIESFQSSQLQMYFFFLMKRMDCFLTRPFLTMLLSTIFPMNLPIAFSFLSFISQSLKVCGQSFNCQFLREVQTL